MHKKISPTSHVISFSKNFLISLQHRACTKAWSTYLASPGTMAVTTPVLALAMMLACTDVSPSKNTTAFCGFSVVAAVACC